MPAFIRNTVFVGDVVTRCSGFAQSAALVGKGG